MPTTCKYTTAGRQEFDGDAQMIAVGTISSNQQVANSTTETALLSESFAAGELDDANIHFRVTLAGEISSTGTGDCTLTLRYGTTDILAVATVSLADEDDKPWRMVVEGRIHTTGATGKVVAHGNVRVDQGTPLTFVADTAAAGATVDLTAAGSLNVTAHWDAADADNDIIAMVGFVELFK